MRRRARTAMILLASTFLGLVTSPVYALERELAWSDYRLGQFVSTRGQTPGDILDLDNNGEILLACRDGCTKATLDSAGVPVLDSQLELLRAWSLLIEDGDGLRAAIPVLDAAGAAVLRKRTSDLADRLASAAAPEVAAVVAQLDSEGWAGHAYAVVFSHVLDGAVWLFFDELGLVGRRNISRGGAPWGGEVWAYVSEREAEPRSSGIGLESIAVKVSWVEPLQPLVTSLLRGPLGMKTLFTEFLEKGETPSPEIRAKLIDHRVLGDEGQLTVPVIRRDREDKLFRACDDLSTKVAESVIAELDRPALVAELGLESESQALVIAYHEVMWGLMERLVESGAVELPKAMREPESARPADIGELVVMTRSVESPSVRSDQDED